MPIGTNISVSIRLDAAVRSLVSSVEVLVLEREWWDTGFGWWNAPLYPNEIGYSGEFLLRADPHVSFYIFALETVEGETLYYVPCIDGRSTAGELVRGGVDGELTEEGWKYSIEKWAMRPVGEFGLQEMLPGFQISVYEPAFASPAWAEGSIMYQIFPDRFYRGSAGVRAQGVAYHERMGRPVILHESWNDPVKWKGELASEADETDQTAVAGEAAADDKAAVVGEAAVANDDEAASADGAVAVDENRADRKDSVHDDGAYPLESDAEGEDRVDGQLAAQMEAYDPVDFYGGTLEGVREKLGYLASLGVEVIYFNPIFEARSNHRYDTADYERIDPLLGTVGDFKRLAKEARQLGISIVLDAVLSHTGDDSRYFNVNGAYDSPGAMQGDSSPFYKWYDFANPSEGSAYRCWWGYPSLPEVNEQDESWQNYMLGECAANPGGRLPGVDVQRASAKKGAVKSDTETGVLGAWLHAGARGYRLDVADEIPDEVLEKIRTSVKRADPDAVIIGEVWEDATVKTSYGMSRTYALGRSLDSVMNYPLRSALIGFAIGSIDAHQLSTFLMQQKANYPAPMYAMLMNLLSTHDVERIRSVLALKGSFKQLQRDEQIRVVAEITSDQDADAASMQRMIVSLLYALPGMPCVYYGDECGMQGGGDPFCRATFPWADANGDAASACSTRRRIDCGIDLTDFYRRIGSMRKGSPALRKGLFASIAPDSDVICVLRYDSEQKVAVVAAANRSGIPRRVAVDLFSPALSLPPAAQMALRNALVVGSPEFCSGDDQADIEHISCEGGIVHLVVPPCSTTYWQAEP